MDKERFRRLAHVGLLGISLLLLARAARGEEDSRARIRATCDRIKLTTKECREAESAGEAPPIEALRAELDSLAVDAEGLRALAKFRDHPIDYVALLAVRAIAGAPEDLKLCAGVLLAARVDARYLNDERRVVFIETVRALGGTGYLGGVRPLLRTLLRTKDPTVCQAIVEALGRLGDPRAVEQLHDRLNTGTSVNLRGPDVGTGQRRRGMNPRQQTGVDGKKNNEKVELDGRVVETLAADAQPVDEQAVVNEIYAVLSKLLGDEFTSWHAIDRFLRENRKDLKTAQALAERKCREQEREAARLLR